MGGLQSIAQNQTGTKLSEYVSQDVSTIFYRQYVVVQLHKMTEDGKSPDLLQDIPTPPMGMALTGIIANYKDGIAKIEYYFQGERDSSIQTDLVQSAEGSLTTEPITNHPYISYLVKNYSRGMKNGKVLWNQYIQSASSNPNESGDGAASISPFSNLESYLNSSMTYTISKSFSTIPNLRLEDVGHIATTPPFGNLPQLPTNYPNGWLYAGFTIDQHGAIYQVTLHYLKSGPGGWQVDIYGGGVSSLK